MLTREQHDYLLNNLRSTRVAKRSQGGKQLSYLEAWDVKAHLIRIFGFGNFDSEVVQSNWITDRPYQNQGKEMVEVSYKATVRLTIRDPQGAQLCVYQEAAVGSASGPVNMTADHHDNALKTAASDALKRCAINLGTQFGLSLYDDGTTTDVVKRTLVVPADDDKDATGEPVSNEEPISDEKMAVLEKSLGATVVPE